MSPVPLVGAHMNVRSSVARDSSRVGSVTVNGSGRLTVVLGALVSAAPRRNAMTKGLAASLGNVAM